MVTYLYIDGGCHNNQEPSKRDAYGSFLVTNEQYPNHATASSVLKTFSYGNITNNQAEYRTLQEALNYCLGASINGPIIFTDSALMVNQLNGKFKTKDAGLKQLKHDAAILIAQLNAELQQVPREILVGVLGH